MTDWFCKYLSINIKKSNYIIFRPRQKRQIFDIKVILSNRDVIQVKETVFLGVILDEHLIWIPHITNRDHYVKALNVGYRVLRWGHNTLMAIKQRSNICFRDYEFYCR